MEWARPGHSEVPESQVPVSASQPSTHQTNGQTQAPHASPAPHTPRGLPVVKRAQVTRPQPLCWWDPRGFCAPPGEGGGGKGTLARCSVMKRCGLGGRPDSEHG